MLLFLGADPPMKVNLPTAVELISFKNRCLWRDLSCSSAKDLALRPMMMAVVHEQQGRTGFCSLGAWVHTHTAIEFSCVYWLLLSSTGSCYHSSAMGGTQSLCGPSMNQPHDSPGLWMLTLPSYIYYWAANCGFLFLVPEGKKGKKKKKKYSGCS